MDIQTIIKEKITNMHDGDKKQLEAIFSDANRLIIEAPAGYGKTKTLISKIAYLLACKSIPSPKRVLALTFSVNAAYKIKKDVAEQIPKMMDIDGYSPVKLNDKIFISNYHGFCRRILKLYGYLLNENLKNIDKIKNIDDSNAEYLYELKIGLSIDQVQEISEFNSAIKNVQGEKAKKLKNKYKEYILNYFLPNNYLPFNAILLLVYELFCEHPEILNFYQQYYPVILIDEFQDTNILSWNLLIKLTGEDTKVILIGDSLQRIYGFIGAISNLLYKAQNKFGMTKITLEKNYRFHDNQDMLLLDKNLRLNAENPYKPACVEDARVQLKVFNNQTEKGEWISNKIDNLLNDDKKAKLAILFRGRNANADILIEELKQRNVDFFYGLFKEDDFDYIQFHNQCLYEFEKSFIDKRITKVRLEKYLADIQKNIKTTDKNYLAINSLHKLLKIFLNRIIIEYSFLTSEEKILFVKDTLESRALKQNMEFVSNRVILSTIHAAKGLEWEYVMMADMEQYCFPNYPSLCGICNFKHNSIDEGNCKITIEKSIEPKFLEELSVFYVGVTRAKRQVFFTASKTRMNNSGKELVTYVNCFLNLHGIVQYHLQ